MNTTKKTKLVYGVGINDADYVVQKFEKVSGKLKLLWICPFYSKWKHMLERCYSSKSQEKRPTYKTCYVCDEWLSFTTFRKWMERQDWEGKQLDKDILFPNNKVYSPDTCVFVDAKVNLFLIESNAARGEYKIGVYWHKQSSKFMAYCKDGYSKLKYLGLFNTEDEAHQAWLTFKRKIAKILASEQTDERVAKAIIARYENYGGG